MTSKVEIANGALQRLGAERIESLTQGSPNARTMNAAFNRVLKAEMRRYDWGFATRRASIAADGSETKWGSHKRYSVPNDYLRLLRDDESDAHVDWRIEVGASGEGVFIVTDDASPLEIRYIAFIEDPNYYDSLFIEAVECKLAEVCCKEVTGSNDLKDRMKDDYRDAIAEARRLGAIEKPAQTILDSDWITARA